MKVYMDSLPKKQTYDVKNSDNHGKKVTVIGLGVDARYDFFHFDLSLIPFLQSFDVPGHASRFTHDGSVFFSLQTVTPLEELRDR